MWWRGRKAKATSNKQQQQLNSERTPVQKYMLVKWLQMGANEEAKGKNKQIKKPTIIFIIVVIFQIDSVVKINFIQISKERFMKK